MFAVVDTETTGFSNADRIIEIGVVICDPNGTPVAEWDSLINPGPGPIGPTHIHGISRDMLIDAPRFEDIADSLGRLLSGNLLVAHNAPFDARMLRNEYDRLGVTVPLSKGQYTCTLRQSRLTWPQATSYTLEDLCSLVGVHYPVTHRALADAQATAAVLKAMIAAGTDHTYMLRQARTRAWPETAATSGQFSA